MESLEIGAINFWLLIVPAAIFLLLFAVSERRTVALALLTSTVVHGALAGYLWCLPSHQQASGAPHLVDPFPMALPPPNEPPLDGTTVDASPGDPRLSDQLHAQAPKFDEADGNLRLPSSTKFADLGKAPDFPVVPLPSFSEPAAKQLQRQPIDLDDLISKRLRDAGGKEGQLTVTLIWFNKNDLDLHVKDPAGNWIYFANRQGKLDVDRNAFDGNLTDQPVENIRWLTTPPVGKYTVLVDHYRVRVADPTRFIVRVKFGPRVVHLLHGVVTRDPNGSHSNPEIKLIEFNYP